MYSSRFGRRNHRTCRRFASRKILGECRQGVKKRRNLNRKNTKPYIKSELAYSSTKCFVSTTVDMSETKTTEQYSFYINELLGSLKNLDPSNQLEIWKVMIEKHPFNFDQLRSLRTAIDDRIRLDIISGVPYEIALYILSFLSPKDLCQAAQTCRSWRIVCEDNRLWREKCKEEGLLEDNQTLDSLFRKRIANRHHRQGQLVKDSLVEDMPKLEWRAAYLTYMHVLKNWRTRKFDISLPFISSDITVQVNQRSDSSLEGLPRPIETIDAPLLSILNNSRRTPRYPLAGLRAITRSLTSLRQSELKFKQNSSLYSRKYPTRIDTSDTGNIIDNHTPPDGHSSGLMQLRCHEESVITCLQFNPRTNTIVSGSDDQTLKVWSSETGRCITTLEGHSGGVWSSQLSPDDTVISGSTDRTLRVWRAHTGELVYILYGHSSTVRCLALDGNYVVSGSRDATLRLWDIKKGICLNVFSGHEAAVRCVEFKNNIIVSGAYDHLVMVWDALTGACCHALECHNSRIYSLQFDGKTIASGSLDSTICIWDAASGKLRHRLEGHTSLTSEMQLTANLLVSVNADTYCKVWNINTGECIQTLGGESKHTSAITSVYFNSRHVVTSSDDGTVKLWDIKTGKFIRNLVVLPTASKGGVVWRIRASYTKLICAVGSRAQTEDTHLLVLDFSA